MLTHPLPGGEQKHRITVDVGLSVPPETGLLPHLSRTPTLALATVWGLGSIPCTVPLSQEKVSFLIKGPVPVEQVPMRN